MSLKKIKLNPLNIINLYNNTLYAASKKEHKKESYSVENEYIFKGNNTKQICVLVNEPEYAFIDDANLDFLQKILSACNVQLQEIALINYAKQAINITNLQSQLNPRIMLLFGVDTAAINLPIIFPLYKAQVFDNVTFIQSDKIDNLKNNATDKKALWECLKIVFKI
jgi:hypothetical protein